MTDDTYLLIVPHTHWDREWYQTFQQFRMRLVRTVDMVLDVLESDPRFSFFMLDGQTIVLEDYLAIRPENSARLRALASRGRIQVGPWYLQPDEFLVGGESLIRNLQTGRRMAAPYGGVMPIGYVPDTFGHTGQLPQILRGFNLDNAVMWRGVPPSLKSGAFNWRAPDGSEVLAVWLYDETGYSNAALLPPDAETMAVRLSQIAGRMREKAVTPVLLLMNGSDHLEPQRGLPAVLDAAAEKLAASGVRLALGTLPMYVNTIRKTNPPLPTYTGELRSSYSSHLLPGVLSTRMWLKQRNAAVETAVTRWAEPAAAWAWLYGDAYPKTFLDLAWKNLMHNHPHDSICGCGIDQVHREMLPRFDQSEQIAEEITTRALHALAERVDTRTDDMTVPLVIFNPGIGPRTDAVLSEVQLRFADYEVVDDQGRALPHQTLSERGAQLFDQEVDKSLVIAGLGMATEGRAMGFTLVDAWLSESDKPGQALVEIVISTQGEPDPVVLDRAKAQTAALAARDDITSFRVIAHEAKKTQLLLLARDVPSYGARSFFIRPKSGQTVQRAARSAALALHATPDRLENVHLRVDVDLHDGTLTFRDKRTGSTFSGLNRIVDSGDVGDLYNYSPPACDATVSEPRWPPAVELIEAGPVRATLRVTRVYALPRSCAADRAARSGDRVDCRVVSDISLTPTAHRVEIRTTVENTARDHRMRALFPVPFVADEADAEGVFEVTRRPARYPEPGPNEPPLMLWVENPVNTHPQKRFVDVSSEDYGLAVLNHGLPEYEVMPMAGGAASAVALTLLRSVEWLSRADLTTRRGHAGPELPTPEAQGLGTHTFEYALVPHAGNWRTEDAAVLCEAQAFEAPMRAAVTERHAGKLPRSISFIHTAPSSLAVSAIKRAEDEDSLVVRVYNPLDTAVRGELILARPFRAVRLVNLNEDDVAGRGDELARILSTGVRIGLRAGEIKTLLFSLEPVVESSEENQIASQA